MDSDKLVMELSRRLADSGGLQLEKPNTVSSAQQLAERLAAQKSK